MRRELWKGAAPVAVEASGLKGSHRIQVWFHKLSPGKVKVAQLQLRPQHFGDERHGTIANDSSGYGMEPA